MASEISHDDIENLRRLLNWATPGPWLVERSEDHRYTAWYAGPARFTNEDDAKLISEVRRLLAPLLAVADSVLSPQQSLGLDA